jgi:ABC-type transporter Mla maintaining outer membrane lipid asymmetry ATPase subunit MlaF
MIELHDLALDAPDGRLLVQGLGLQVPRGGNQLLTGPGGWGKSRLLKVIAGIERPVQGTVRVGGRQLWPGDGVLSLIGQVRLGFAFAAGGLLSNLTLRENVALPLRFQGVPPVELRQRTEAALDRLGLLAVADLRPHAVGVSARKHGNLARVLALQPHLLLLDDPLEGLDAEDRDIALELVEGWAADPACTLVIAAEAPDAFTHLEAERLQLSPAPVESP